MERVSLSPSTAVLELRDVSKWYGKGESRFQALDSISLTIERGESVAIVGKSGSGKSTLMHILATLDTPDIGKLLIDGQDAASLPKRQMNRLRNRMFGFVFQQFFLTALSSDLDNVTLPLKIAGVGTVERRRRGLEILAMFDLADKAKNKATDLSGGQKQRVVLSRALVGHPEVVFADEPTGNLDSASGSVVEDELFSLNRERGIALVIVTHDEEFAARCDRQLHIRDGKLVTAVEARA